ncbi:hypothetical protein [Amycolatopsis benzoatilytica]|uniref:hypothetical protein n=1 Tax=Amycolatopsis benzoatilytica TaxID=346045 RepID=UPI00037E899B|nr:hypothetical protein [Amycolatopsis benzoatilytica]
MRLDSAIAVAISTGVVGLIVLIVLWPNEKQGTRLLVKWGVPNLAADQVSVAVRYLRRRRFWYPWLFIGLPLIPHAEDLARAHGLGSIVFVALFGGLIAEVLAQRSSREPRKEALLAPRGVLDFAPLWTIIVAGLATGIAAVHLAVQGQWPQTAVILGSAAVSWLIVLLAVRRPAAGDPEADLALRTRSARVALGLSVGTTGTLGWSVGTMSAFIAFVATIAAFLAIVGPPAKPRTTTRAAR